MLLVGQHEGAEEGVTGCERTHVIMKGEGCLFRPSRLVEDTTVSCRPAINGTDVRQAESRVAHPYGGAERRAMNESDRGLMIDEPFDAFRCQHHQTANAQLFFHTT